jgi:penicillin-binding protein 1A
MFRRLTKLIWLGFFCALGLFALWVHIVSIDLNGWFGSLPDFRELENPKNAIATEIYTHDEKLLGKLFYENRSPVEYEDLSQNLVNTLLATEDVRFFDHSGIDFISMMRVFRGLITFSPQGGGSTVSQQLAKNLFKTRDAKYKGKLSGISRFFDMVIIKTKEWIVAVHIERSYTKKEIMTMYFNTVDFGMNSFGIRVASKKYFKKTPKNLTYDEAAVLVGMLKAPTKYNPVLNPDNALYRRNTVLEQLEKYEFISSGEMQFLKSKPMQINPNVFKEGDHNEGLATYFRLVIEKQVRKWCNERGLDIYADGLRIYTTLDSTMQAYAEAAMEKHMKYLQKQFFDHWKGRNPWIDENGKELPNLLGSFIRQSERYKILKSLNRFDSLGIIREMSKPQKMKVFSWHGKNYETDTVLSPIDSIRYYKHFLHVGMMGMEPKTGEVRVWVGGINYRNFKFDHVKQGARQPGSTFKPIVYAAAISEKGLDPCYKVVDAPITFSDPSYGTWTAKNSSGYSGESLTLRQALARSVNTVAAFLIREVGPREVIRYARDMGITTPLDQVPALCLGPSDVTVYDLTGAYSVFANRGTWIEPYYIKKITDKNGRVLYEAPKKTKEVFSPGTAYAMVHMLRGSTEEKGGTALGLYRYEFRKKCEVAAKTGTTSNHSDGWFMGGTQDLMIGIWTGGDERSIRFRDMNLGQGARMAMPIFGYFMDALYADENLLRKRNYKGGKFDVPSEAEKKFELDCSKGGAANSNVYYQPTDEDIFN